MKFSLAFGRGARFLIGIGLACAGGLRGQDTNAPLNQQQVDQLMGPIALYPDALVAIILPASTVPGDVVLAARFVANGGDPDQIDNQGWSESVKALAHYPTLLKWMDDNLPWTQQLGYAFLNQPDDLMTAVQRLRTRARASGALISTPQQKVLLDGDDIEIVPAQPDVIYVPYYDPDVVYVARPDYYYGGPYLTFGLGLPIGFWLDYDFNWRTRVILIGDRHHNWRENRDWSHQTWSGGNQRRGSWHTWTPPATRPPFARPDSHRPRPDIVQPNPVPGSPVYNHDSNRRAPDRPRPDTNTRNPGPRPDTTPRDTDRNRPPAPVPVVPVPADTRDDHDHRDRRPPAPVTPPVTVRPDANPGQIPMPQPRVRDGSVPPVPVRPEHSAPPVPVPDRTDRTNRDAPRPDRQPPQRPEPREVPTPRPVAQPPPPPVKDSDPRDGKDRDVAR